MVFSSLLLSPSPADPSFRITERMVVSNIASVNGFGRKAFIPAFSYFSLSSLVQAAEIPTTGMADPLIPNSSRINFVAFNPSIPGILTSMNSRLKRSALTISNASIPFTASRKPTFQRSSIVLNSMRLYSSSSTIRIFKCLISSGTERGGSTSLRICFSSPVR